MRIDVPFEEKEIRCNCGCLRMIINEEFILRLSAARTIANTPFVITSWTRCHKHNKAVGGKQNSAHLDGIAADVYTPDSIIRQKVLFGAIKAGFQRIGIHEDYIHLDIDNSKPRPRVWVY
jgi:uncharacterized protein YcbK (DUF882 family)